MAKDPALLFYTKDWLTDTMEMNARERGVYINLLAYQHINESLPTDKDKLFKIALCGEDENFDKIWEGIKHKFIKINGRLFNKRLSETVSERLSKAYKNKIIGEFGAIIKNENLTERQKSHLKKTFYCNDFLNIPSERLSESLSEWLSSSLSSLEDANANAINKGESMREGEDAEYALPTDDTEIKRLEIYFQDCIRLPKLREKQFIAELHRKFGYRRSREIIDYFADNNFHNLQKMRDALNEEGAVKQKNLPSNGNGKGNPSGEPNVALRSAWQDAN